MIEPTYTDRIIRIRYHTYSHVTCCKMQRIISTVSASKIACTMKSDEIGTCFFSFCLPLKLFVSFQSFCILFIVAFQWWLLGRFVEVTVLACWLGMHVAVVLWLLTMVFLSSLGNLTLFVALVAWWQVDGHYAVVCLSVMSCELHEPGTSWNQGSLSRSLSLPSEEPWYK